MKPTRLSIRALVTTCVCTLVLGGCQNDRDSAVAPEAATLHNDRSAPAFAVYSQNVYLGGDTGPLFTIGDFNDLAAVLAATGPDASTDSSKREYSRGLTGCWAQRECSDGFPVVSARRASAGTG